MVRSGSLRQPSERLLAAGLVALTLIVLAIQLFLALPGPGLLDGISPLAGHFTFRQDSTTRACQAAITAALITFVGLRLPRAIARVRHAWRRSGPHREEQP